MTRGALGGLALVAVLGACTGAELNLGGTYLTRDGNTVVPLTATSFEVIGRPGNGGSAYFCAAGDFAERFLGASPADRVVVRQPVGPSESFPGRRGTTFELVPREAGLSQPLDSLQSVLVRADVEGHNRTVAHSRQLCGGRTMFNIFDT